MRWARGALAPWCRWAASQSTEAASRTGPRRRARGRERDPAAGGVARRARVRGGGGHESAAAATREASAGAGWPATAPRAASLGRPLLRRPRLSPTGLCHACRLTARLPNSGGTTSTRASGRRRGSGITCSSLARPSRSPRPGQAIRPPAGRPSTPASRPATPSCRAASSPRAGARPGCAATSGSAAARARRRRLRRRARRRQRRQPALCLLPYAHRVTTRARPCSARHIDGSLGHYLKVG